jgi:ABC transporter
MKKDKRKTNPTISIRDVTKTYPGGVEALRGVSLDCAAGKVTALLGRSGCGKTTLLNLCGAMDFPTTGEVRLAGELTSTLSDAGLTQLRRHKIGFVFQFFQLLPSLTALENVELPLLLSGANNTESTAIERLRWVSLEDKLHALPYSSPADKGSASPSPVRWCMIQPFWSPTNPPEIPPRPAARSFCACSGAPPGRTLAADPCALSTLLQFGEIRFTGGEGY